MSNLGLTLAVGTDGPSSNNALDMFREMYLISILQKLKHNDAAAMDANEILKAATVGSARCMGLDNCDCIAEGKFADLTVIDLNRPNMHLINNITKNLVYSGSKDDVKMTVINGKILYENGEFVNIDKEEIYFSAQEVTNRLKNKSQSQIARGLLLFSKQQQPKFLFIFRPYLFLLCACELIEKVCHENYNTDYNEDTEHTEKHNGK